MKLRSLIFIVALLATNNFAQGINKITALCPNSLFASVIIRADGSIYYKPCIGSPNIFAGVNDFSTASKVILPSGTANVNAGQSNIVVNHSKVTTNSILIVMARSNDVTCAVRNYVPVNGSFTINMTANCTGTTSIGYIITN